MRKFLLVVIFCAAPVTARAETSFGFVGGANLGDAVFNAKNTGATANSDDRIGIAAGIVIDVPVNSVIYFGTDILYIQKGATLPGNVKLHYDVVEVPLLLKLKFDTEFVRPIVFGGPSLGIAINREALDASGARSNASSVLNPFEFSVQMGAGAEFALGESSAFVVTGRYIKGLSNVLDSGSLSMNTRNVVVTAGILFDL